MKETRKKAAGYLRRSTDRQEQSIEDQRRAILGYAEARGFLVNKFYIDDAISGTVTDDRKAFQQLMLDAREPGRLWDFVLVYDVKRFGRIDNDEAGHYRFLLRQAGVDVIYVTENFNGDDTDDLLRPVKQWQARQESKDLSKVTIRGQLSLSEGGWWLGGVPPYGFDLLYFDSACKPYTIVRFLDDGRKEVLDTEGKRQRVLPRGESLSVSKKDHAKLFPSTPERVATVRLIFELHLRGMGYRAIAEYLNAKEVPSPRTSAWARIHDGRWSMSTIREILANPNYAEDMVWNRRTLAKFHRISNGRAAARAPLARNHVEHNPKDDWIVVPNAHEAIIAKDVLDRVHQLRADRGGPGKKPGPRGGRAKTSPYLLSGILRCGRCHHGFQGHTVTKAKRRNSGERVKTFYYVCSGYVNKGTAVCEKRLLRQDAFDGLIVAEVGKRMTDFLSTGGRSLLRQAIEASLSRPTSADPGRVFGEVEARLAEIERKADELLEVITPANRDFIDSKLERLRQERQTLQGRKQVLEAEKARAKDVHQLADEVLSELTEFQDVFREGTPEEQKAFIRAFVPEIVMEPDAGKAVVRIRKFPPPLSRGGGNLSFDAIAGGGFEPPTSGL